MQDRDQSHAFGEHHLLYIFWISRFFAPATLSARLSLQTSASLIVESLYSVNSHLLLCVLPARPATPYAGKGARAFVKQGCQAPATPTLRNPDLFERGSVKSYEWLQAICYPMAIVNEPDSFGSSAQSTWRPRRGLSCCGEQPTRHQTFPT